ncbi:hypothetical protein IV494_06545 [Kaistella sp. G5-32]|uniref:Uncharacterized protein n=1 Tax=Kaistella gelatinilytica TaxID=2787636 RepID=A0ABS0FB09_9FLAO|nr:hypothetical protein [Kaistella gelatinilytica]MBF8456840.1 hypothetical protein [Kaistella gelatinilytica]
MKIRIKGNSIRLRLTKTDIQNLKEKGIVEEKTIIGTQEIFKYSLVIDEKISTISAEFQANKITVFLSKNEAEILTETDEITVDGSQNNGEEKGLFLLVEKDLQCLDITREDQADMYENTKTHC